MRLTVKIVYSFPKLKRGLGNIALNIATVGMYMEGFKSITRLLNADGGSSTAPPSRPGIHVPESLLQMLFVQRNYNEREGR